MGVLPLEPVGGEGGGEGAGEMGGGVGKGELYNSAYLAFCLLDAVKCQKNDCMFPLV